MRARAGSRRRLPAGTRRRAGRGSSLAVGRDVTAENEQAHASAAATTSATSSVASLVAPSVSPVTPPSHARKASTEDDRRRRRSRRRRRARRAAAPRARSPRRPARPRARAGRSAHRPLPDARTEASGQRDRRAARHRSGRDHPAEHAAGRDELRDDSTRTSSASASAAAPKLPIRESRMISSERSRVIPPVASSVSARPSRWNAPVRADGRADRDCGGEERRQRRLEQQRHSCTRRADRGTHDGKERRGARDVVRVGRDEAPERDAREEGDRRDRRL